jgi:hypothetical protein
VTHAIDSIEWVHTSELFSNSWNPNVVFNKELKLLEESILGEAGWVFPIIINRNGMIIDGYHRWFLGSNSKKIIARDNGLVPCVRVDIGDKEAIMMTVRMNRAKGTHAALRMRDLVQTLVDDYGTTPDEMIQKMGMTEGEVALLYDGTLLKRKNLQTRKYSRAWVPVETKLMTDEEREEFERETDD